jgi:hypothetical protein
MFSNKVLLNREMEAWNEQIIASLAKAENQLLNEQRPEGEAPKQRTWRIMIIPDRPDQLFRLLNWKIWTMRYKVPLEFILMFILKRYSSHRKISKDPKVLTLGLPVVLITGVACRKQLEEHISKIYPNGENYQAARCPQPPIVTDLPEDEDMVAAYNHEMLRRHKKALVVSSNRRHYRKA